MCPPIMKFKLEPVNIDLIVSTMLPKTHSLCYFELKPHTTTLCDAPSKHNSPKDLACSNTLCGIALSTLNTKFQT